MPKKRAPLQFTKPATPVHPSLESSESNTSSKTSSGTSVNELLQRQRLNSAKPITRSERPQTNISSVPPSLNAILNVPDTPPPRPRRGTRPAGPPPPTSWLNSSFNNSTHHDPRSKETQINQHAITRDPLTSLRTLPDLFIPHKRSLVYQTLNTLAKNWDWHLQYDQHYLATLPVRYKETLVGLIAHHSADGVRLSDLEVLFLDDTMLETSTGSGDVTHLDLSKSVGRRLNLKELKDYLIKKPVGFTVLNPDNTGGHVPEVWEDSTPFTILQPEPRFSLLTHLSLSRPRNPSWKQLLDLAPHLATLTHLSLAYWPTPSLTPNSKTAYRKTPYGEVNYSPTNYYSHSIDNDWSEAAGILKRLGKAAYCLKWLDLTGCSGCISALLYDNTVIRTGTWRGLECIKVGQGWVPEYFKDANTNWIHTWLDSISDKPESERRASWLELQDWVTYEVNIEILKRKRVQTRLTEPGLTTPTAIENASRAPEQGRPAQTSPAIWWDEPQGMASPSACQEKGTYGSHVIVDRGWDAWWIECALRTLIAYDLEYGDFGYPPRIDRLEELDRSRLDLALPIP